MVFRCTFVGCSAAPLCCAAELSSATLRPLCEPSIVAIIRSELRQEGLCCLYSLPILRMRARDSKTRLLRSSAHMASKNWDTQCFSWVRVYLKNKPRKCHGMDSKIGAHVILSQHRQQKICRSCCYFFSLLLLLWFVIYKFFRQIKICLFCLQL